MTLRKHDSMILIVNAIKLLRSGGMVIDHVALVKEGPPPGILDSADMPALVSSITP